jgi:hypothetical protein
MATDKKAKATEVAFIYQSFALIIQMPLNWIVHGTHWLAGEVL